MPDSAPRAVRWKKAAPAISPEDRLARGFLREMVKAPVPYLRMIGSKPGGATIYEDRMRHALLTLAVAFLAALPAAAASQPEAAPPGAAGKSFNPVGQAGVRLNGLEAKLRHSPNDR